MPIKVLLVDDSAIIRGLLAKALSSDPGIVIADTAADGIMAIQVATRIQPDIIVLDIEMPRMDGITALPELLKAAPATKIIMASTLTSRNASISLEALALGASDYIAKPSAQARHELEDFYRELIAKIHALSGRHTAPRPPASAPAAAPAAAAPAVVKPVSKPYRVLAAGTSLNALGIAALAIASSTGGPQALTALFTQLKGKLQNIPIFVTQHMPPTFTALLAAQLGKAGERPFHEAQNDEIVMPGHAYLAAGNFHMTVVKNPAGQLVLRLNQEPPENFCRPAADPMLRSLSSAYGARLAACVLTGMGQDGLEGAKVVVKNGGSVIAQNEATCIVYGMPKAVVDADLCKAVLPLADIAPLLIQQIDGSAS